MEETSPIALQRAVHEIELPLDAAPRTGGRGPIVAALAALLLGAAAFSSLRLAAPCTRTVDVAPDAAVAGAASASDCRGTARTAPQRKTGQTLDV